MLKKSSLFVLQYAVPKGMILLFYFLANFIILLVVVLLLLLLFLLVHNAHSFVTGGRLTGWHAGYLGQAALFLQKIIHF